MRRTRSSSLLIRSPWPATLKIVGDRVAERSEAGGKVIELAVVRGDNFAQPSDFGGAIVELAVVPGHRAGDLRQQLVDGCDIRPDCGAHAKN